MFSVGFKHEHLPSHYSRGVCARPPHDAGRVHSAVVDDTVAHVATALADVEADATTAVCLPIAVVISCWYCHCYCIWLVMLLSQIAAVSGYRYCRGYCLL